MAKVEFTALLNRVVAKRENAIVKSSGGILMPDVAVAVQINCVVVAIGPKVEGLKVGDRVMVNYSHGFEHNMEDGNSYVFTSPEQILAIINKDMK